jgi:hypothetical protein
VISCECRAGERPHKQCSDHGSGHQVVASAREGLESVAHYTVAQVEGGFEVILISGRVAVIALQLASSSVIETASPPQGPRCRDPQPPGRLFHLQSPQ